MDDAEDAGEMDQDKRGSQVDIHDDLHHELTTTSSRTSRHAQRRQSGSQGEGRDNSRERSAGRERGPRPGKRGKGNRLTATDTLFWTLSLSTLHLILFPSDILRLLAFPSVPTPPLTVRDE